MSVSTLSGTMRASLAIRLATLCQRNERTARRSGVVGRRSHDLIVVALLDDVRAPARSPCDHEERRKHGRWYAHEVIRDGAEPVEIRKHLFFGRHHRFDAIGNIE